MMTATVDSRPCVIVVVRSGKPSSISHPQIVIAYHQRVSGVSAVPIHRQLVQTSLITDVSAVPVHRQLVQTSLITPLYPSTVSWYRPASSLRCTRPPSAGTDQPHHSAVPVHRQLVQTSLITDVSAVPIHRQLEQTSLITPLYPSTVSWYRPTSSLM